MPLLLTWLVLDRAPQKWFVPPIIALMLAWAVIGDQLILLIAVAPLAAVSAVRAYQILVQRREGWRNGWFDVSLLVAAAAAVEISRIVIREISAHGGYTVLPVPAGVAPVTDMSAHLWLLVQSICGIYGADLFGMTSIGLDGAIALLHVIGLALAAWALWLVIRRFFSCEDRIAQLLTVGILVNLVAYMLSTTPTTYWSAREVAPVLAMGAALAGRMLGRRLWKARLVPALSLVLACYLAALGYSVTKPAIPAVTQNLADWLAAHNLTYGLSSYGISNTTTLASGETVNVRPHSPGELGKHRSGGRALRVRQVLVRPHPALRELRGAHPAAPPHRPDRALGGAGLLREAGAHLLLQPVHDHGLQQEPADRPGPVAAPAAAA